MPPRRDADEKRLRDLLRDLRAEAGLRQVDLATRLGRPQSFVSKYEAGERRLAFLDVRDVCRAVGVSLAVFAQRFERG